MAADHDRLQPCSGCLLSHRSSFYWQNKGLAAHTVAPEVSFQNSLKFILRRFGQGEGA